MLISKNRLPLWQKLVYGSGAFSISSFGMLRQILYAIFVTDVVGLDPRLASFGALIGISWDAVNDPLVGVLSDRVRSRWGRRRPFLLIFAIPFGLSFMLQWWAPPIENQFALAAYVTLAFALSDTFSTLVSVPYSALTPEITPFNLFPRKYAHSFLSAGVGSSLAPPARAGARSFPAWCMVLGLERFGGMIFLP